MLPDFIYTERDRAKKMQQTLCLVNQPAEQGFFIAVKTIIIKLKRIFIIPR